MRGRTWGDALGPILPFVAHQNPATQHTKAVLRPDRCSGALHVDKVDETALGILVSFLICDKCPNEPKVP